MSSIPGSRDVITRFETSTPRLRSAALMRAAPGFPSMTRSSGFHSFFLLKLCPSQIARFRQSFPRSDLTQGRVLVKVAGDKAVLDRPGCDLGLGPDPQLVSDSLDVALRGALGDEQPLRYLPAGQTGCDQSHHLALSAAERADLCARFRLGPARAQRVLERPGGAHRLTVVPGAVALSRAKPSPGALGCLFELADPGRPGAQRPLTRHAADDRRQTQSALVVVACRGHERETSNAPDGAKGVIELPERGERLHPARRRRIEVVQPELGIRQALQEASCARFVTL